ncbi:MAG: hypothetical protein A2599_00660 [Candidatus Staskawiczbacteria bacterium RIFOXYD1_FULL_39_28]|uniref:Uncharacterized protein n=1 Tax=Candidatus Staskawiczbacteria bacterium RIFOXYC1_FULL_38_18 TaxID=1802229 RepID=A0A1G2JAV3_9BACT|nr:MAG: hypothetical protein A2401_02545 [Candidatus Staskawiczbacteria bacterium RIFOXYC1_FULL_38_18]OGZ90665.1 MAG: hypothetical protein A2599_00660 [Candidatus Staskawiczbacteria bacterium RIFOXYD1_FULL_39_28]
MSCAQLSLVAVLLRKVNIMLEQRYGFESLMRLMKELIEAKADPALSGRERREIYELGSRVELRVIEIIHCEADEAVGDLPRQLKWQRDNLRALALEAPTANLRKELRASANKIQELLDKGSENVAESFLLNVESAISSAGEMLTGAEPDSNISVVESRLDRAESAMKSLRTIPHVKFVGLPRVAKKRGIAPDELFAGFDRRIAEANLALTTLRTQKDERDRREAERGHEALKCLQEDAHECYVQMTQRRREEIVEEAVVALERRNKLAGLAARQFLANIKTENTGAARVFLNEIRRRDGGIPPVLQEELGRALQVK